MEIPPILREQARQGRVILLLGAGASIGAKDRHGKRPPSGAELSKHLSEKFLGGQFNSADLSTVSEFAVSELGLLAVQQELHDIFCEFEPTDAHRLLPKFSWGGLATTNYDLLVEKAYHEVSGALQNPVPFIENGDQVIESLRNPKSVMFLKLHGCITRITNEDCPLILTKDQYITYRKGRDRIFQHLHEWAYEHTIVFIGHSMQDTDLREVIFELDQKLPSRPRYFLVGPNRSEIEKRFWETKKVTVIDGVFLDFLTTLDGSLGDEFRGLRIPTVQMQGISRHFRVADAVLSKNASEFLLNEANFVQTCTATKQMNPLDFYRGYNEEWAPIEQNLDVPRPLVDDILEDIFLRDDLQARGPIEVILIKGYAGSGKTIALRRLAWQAAKDYDCLCLYVNDAALINIGALQEIAEICRERIFLFLDNAADRAHDIRKLLHEIGDAGEFLTVICASRQNEWNSVYGDVQGAITDEYELPPLRHIEVIKLLELLDKHNALGRLEEKNPEERIQALEALAGRQLLVALHEATLGLPFEEILENEFRNLAPEQAQRVYLTVCILNRLDVPVRAGIISRIHGIPFSAFKERLFKPLEHVVYDSFDERIRDHVYKARHPIIAEIVFERLLRDEKERFEEYYRCLTALNVDYSTDKQAFRQLIRGRTLLKLFSNPDYCSAIFDEATRMVGDEPHLLQQKALYEMHRQNGNLNLASTYLTNAIAHQPYNKSFKHTKSELALKKADTARTALEREKLLREAAALAVETKEQRYGDTYSYHTLAKVNIKRLEDALGTQNEDFSNPTLQNIVRSIESVISEGLQNKPGDPYLLNEQARLAKMLHDSPRTIAALEKAVANNSRLTFLAIQLADCYLNAGDNEKAKKVYEAALNLNRNDRELNYRYGRFLDDRKGPLSEIIYYLKRSFSPGDKNYDAQLRYCRSLFLKGEYDDARREFQYLRNNNGAPYHFGQRLYEADASFFGLVTAVRHSHILVTEQKSQLTVFIPHENVKSDIWKQLTEGSRVKFRLAFNFRGLLGFGCEIA